MRNITLTNVLGRFAIVAGLTWCVLILSLVALFFIGTKSLDKLLLLLLTFPLCAFACLGVMAINRGRALIKMKTKGNILSTIEALSVFAGILFVILMTVVGSLVFSGIILPYVFFVAFSVLGIIIHVVGCRFVLRKEGFEFTKGELLGKNLAQIIAIIVFLTCLGSFPYVWGIVVSNAYPGDGLLFFVIPIFIAFGVYRFCCWGFKRI